MNIGRFLFTFGLMLMFQQQFASGQDGLNHSDPNGKITKKPHGVDGKGDLSSGTTVKLKDVSRTTLKSQRKIIVAQNVTNLAHFPYIVSLRKRRPKPKNGEPFCEGAIINKYWVVTAAHCLWYPPNDVNLIPNQIEVIYGDLFMEKVEHKTDVCFLDIHPDWPISYNYDNWNDDIGLILVSKPFIWSANVGEIKIAPVKLPADMTCVTAGWGFGKNMTNNQLKYVETKVYSNCWRHVEERHSKNRICAGQKNEEKGLCRLYTGGPLVCHTYLTGVLAHSDSCGPDMLLDHYTSVFEYRNWIDKMIENKEPCE